eukprot:gene5918-6517_t
MSLIENLQVSLINLVMHRSNGEEINFSLQTTISETLRTVRENLIANTIPTAAMISSETGNQSPRISTTSETIPSPRRQFVQQQRSNSNHSVTTSSSSSSSLLLYYSTETPESISNQIQALALLKSLISALPALLPDARKDIATIFTILLHEDISGFVDYLSTQMSSIVSGLVDGYKDVNIALICGQMLRECVQYEKLCWQILSFPELLWPFFDVYVHIPQFEVASDAFSTIKEIITAPKCKNLSREFLSVNAEIFLDKYEALLQSENYVTKRKALKLLTELLLDRSYHKMMMIFISSKLHLKTIMNMLKSKSMQIQYESFHVFKIFVANPHKSYEVASILYNNKEKLITFLQTFLNEREDFNLFDEKESVIELLKELPNPEGGKLKRFHSTASALHATQPVESSRGSSSSTASQLKSSSASSACLSHMGNMVTTAAPVAKEAFKVNAPPADNTSTVLPPSPPVLPQPVTPVIKSPCLDSLLKNVVSVEDDGVDDDDEGR